MQDVAAERAVLAGAIKYGSDSYYDVADLVSSKTFTLDSNKIIWSCLEHLFANDAKVIDYPSILSAAHSLGYNLFEREEEKNHLRAVSNFPINQDNVRKLAAKIRKLEIARLADLQLIEARSSLSNVTGDESIDDILNRIEGPIFDFTSCLSEHGLSGPKKMGAGASEYLQHLMDNPRQMIGISTGFKRLDKALGGGLRENALDVIIARMKQGKAQPLDAIVQTPHGPKRMGDIKIGDRVCTPTGTSTVVAVHPQGMVPVYRVTFTDGDSTECCENHLWAVNRWQKPCVLPLKTIMAEPLVGVGKGKIRKFSVQLPVECEMDYKEVPIHPYLLGLVLGDGGMTGPTPTLTNIDEDLLYSCKSLLDSSYDLHNSPGQICYRISKGEGSQTPNDYKVILKQLGLYGLTSHYKFIPDVYKYNSSDVRLLVLRGLMDTDGDSDEAGNISLSTSSLRMANDIKFVVNSLGGLCKVTPRYTTCNGKRFLSYRCGIKTNNNGHLFALKRKYARCHTRKKKAIRRSIVSIKSIGNKEAQCITIANPNGLYLTDHCIVTHNSFLGDNIALHVAGKLGIPVYNADTEMSWEEHVHRVAANLSGVPIEEIETGKCGKNLVSRNALVEAAARLDDMPYHYESVIGKPFEEILSGMRRWVSKTVGLEANGKAKPCVIIFDYLKLMSADTLNQKMGEHQALGFITTSLKNFVGRYSTRCLTYAQVNREGINSEDTDIVGASDRIAMYATSIILYKKKTTEERAEAQPYGGTKYTHKFVPLASRFAEDVSRDNYINVLADYAKGRVTEGPTKLELEQQGSGGMNVNSAERVQF